MATGKGVDLHAYYQRGTNALPGIEYGWVKVTDGGRPYRGVFQSKTWTPDALVALFRALRVPVGGYDYAQPGDGAAAAAGLWDECRRTGAIDVTPATDIEDNKDIHTWTKAEATDHGRAFCSKMRALGVRPAVYMSASKAQVVRPDLWPENPVLWIARYGRAPGYNGMYTGRYDVHQYADDGSLPGSAGTVDENQSYSNAHLIVRVDDGGNVTTQDRQIAETRAQLTGSEVPNQYPGFQSMVPGSTVKLTVTDFVRNIDARSYRMEQVLLPAIKAEQDALLAGFNALGAQLSQVFTAIDADLEQIKDAVGVTAAVKASAERISVAAAPLRELCASVEEPEQATLPEDDARLAEAAPAHEQIETVDPTRVEGQE
jgi:hypothetical protein